MFRRKKTPKEEIGVSGSFGKPTTHQAVRRGRSDGSDQPDNVIQRMMGEGKTNADSQSPRQKKKGKRRSAVVDAEAREYVGLLKNSTDSELDNEDGLTRALSEGGFDTSSSQSDFDDDGEEDDTKHGSSIKPRRSRVPERRRRVHSERHQKRRSRKKSDGSGSSRDPSPLTRSFQSHSVSPPTSFATSRSNWIDIIEKKPLPPAPPQPAAVPPDGAARPAKASSSPSIVESHCGKPSPNSAKLSISNLESASEPVADLGEWERKKQQRLAAKSVAKTVNPQKQPQRRWNLVTDASSNVSGTDSASSTPAGVITDTTSTPEPVADLGEWERKKQERLAAKSVAKTVNPQKQPQRRWNLVTDASANTTEGASSTPAGVITDTASTPEPVADLGEWERKKQQRLATKSMAKTVNPQNQPQRRWNLVTDASANTTEGASSTPAGVITDTTSTPEPVADLGEWERKKQERLAAKSASNTTNQPQRRWNLVTDASANTTEGACSTPAGVITDATSTPEPVADLGEWERKKQQRLAAKSASNTTNQPQRRWNLVTDASANTTEGACSTPAGVITDTTSTPEPIADLGEWERKKQQRLAAKSASNTTNQPQRRWNLVTDASTNTTEATKSASSTPPGVITDATSTPEPVADLGEWERKKQQRLAAKSASNTTNQPQRRWNLVTDVSTNTSTNTISTSVGVITDSVSTTEPGANLGEWERKKQERLATNSDGKDEPRAPQRRRNLVSDGVNAEKSQTLSQQSTAQRSNINAYPSVKSPPPLLPARSTGVISLKDTSPRVLSPRAATNEEADMAAVATACAPGVDVSGWERRKNERTAVGHVPSSGSEEGEKQEGEEVDDNVDRIIESINQNGPTPASTQQQSNHGGSPSASGPNGGNKALELLMQTEGMGMLKKIGRRGHVQQLVRAVAANNQSVEVLSLSGLSVKKSQVTALAQALKNNTVVTSLDLSNKGIANGDDISILCSALTENTTLTDIQLRNTGITAKGIKCLDELARKNAVVNRIDVFEDNFLKKKGDLLESVQQLELSVQNNRKFMAFLRGNGHVIDLSNRSLTEISEHYFSIHVTKLDILDVSRNRLSSLPSSIGLARLIRKLKANQNMLSSLPPEMGRLTKLVFVDLSDNGFTEIPEAICKLHQLSHLIIARNALHCLPHNMGQLANLTEVIKGTSASVGILAAIVKLNVAENKISAIPDSCRLLKNLQSLKLQENRISRLPQWLLGLPQLNELLVGGNPIKRVPSDLVQQGNRVLLDYIKSQQKNKKGTEEVARMKLMFVGQENVGKTTLYSRFRKAQESGGRGSRIFGRRHQGKIHLSTDGIDIADVSLKCSSSASTTVDRVELSAWDFAGQEVYYTTHHFFISNRAIYLLCFNLLQYQESEARLEYWLRMIRSRADKAPIVLVGTHADNKACTEQFLKDVHSYIALFLANRHPQVVGFVPVSGRTGKGVDKLSSELISIALQQSYVPETVPISYMALEQEIKTMRQIMLCPVISYLDFEVKALQSGIPNVDEVITAVRMMHELGVVCHFPEVDPEIVILDPQWIADTFATILTTTQSFASGGFLTDNDLRQIWRAPEYTSKVFDFLLLLLEKFQVLYRIPDTEPLRVFIPSLLPSSGEEGAADAYSDRDGVILASPGMLGRMQDHQSPVFGRLFRVEFLPRGFFARCLVRILSRNSLSLKITSCWRDAVVLHNGSDRASLRLRNTGNLVEMLSIQCRGPNAAKALSFMSRVVRLLIRDWVQGVNVEELVPCPHCLRLDTPSPQLFLLSQCKAAKEQGRVEMFCDAGSCSVAIPLRLLGPRLG